MGGIMVTMSAREFNQLVAAAQRLAARGPVTVTRRGEPAYVLLNIDDYRRLTTAGAHRRLSERLAPADGTDLDDIEFDRVGDIGRPIVEL